MELKKCPFCGEDMHYNASSFWCDNGNCVAYVVFFERGEDEEMFNTRPIEAALQSKLDKAVEALEQALGWIMADEHTHGRKFGTGNAIRAALKELKGEHDEQER
jgi:hypothetical protein